ncbi:MAG: hypothetical protein HC933_09530 [Pleurocapsa sp. SU_196_0]|nr:hypothetical protein [Pleurocapsa sp. SU_196_0]
MKLRSGDGGLPKLASSVSVRGPAGWNGDAVASFTYPAGAYWVAAPQTGATPVSGAYTVEAQIGTEKLTGSFMVAAEPAKLELTEITSQLEGEAPNQTVRASWQPVDGAVAYYARVVDGSLGVPASEDVYTLEPRADFVVGSLNSARAYFVVVVAVNLDTVADQPALPGALRMSDSIAALEGMNVQGFRLEG